MFAFYVNFILFYIIVQNCVCEKYIVVKEPVSWFQALINCKNAGMELASVNSEEESKALDKYLTDNGYISTQLIEINLLIKKRGTRIADHITNENKKGTGAAKNKLHAY
ncbi:uncharacterized protein LOC143189247 isoform X2 [Rhynchophorus ferrugineus]|uniref:uncharacterized protein LOC143189247 isoform X2 n=1 Tax=Rhynchophorus ferrugineus TaxID=354439 RepID=UPI003FCC6248